MKFSGSLFCRNRRPEHVWLSLQKKYITFWKCLVQLNNFMPARTDSVPVSFYTHTHTSQYTYLNEHEGESHSLVSNCETPWIVCSYNSPGQNTGVGILSCLQWIFPTQRSSPGLPNCKQIIYQLSHREVQEHQSGQPTPSPVDLPDPGIELGFPALQVDSLPTEL